MKLATSQLRSIIKEELQYVLEYLSEKEKEFFGEEIQTVVDNPDELYYLAPKKSLNPYDEPEDVQYLNTQWIEDNVGPRLGGGSFRDAFEIRSNPNWIFKISNRAIQNEKYDGKEWTTVAEETNQHEIDNFNQYPEFFPKVGPYDKEIKGIPRWLVVEKVNPTQNEQQFLRQIHISFPGVRKSFEAMLDAVKFWMEDSKQKPTEQNYHEWISTVFYAYLARDFQDLKPFIYKTTDWDNDYGDDLKIGVDRAVDNEILVDEILKKPVIILTSDPKLAKFVQMVRNLKIDWTEIAEGNVGTDLKTGKKFLLIDISIFDDLNT